MHPILGGRGGLALFLTAWIPLAVLLATMFALAGATRWLDAVILIVPTADIYAFVCLSTWYVCRSLPLRTTPPLRVLGTHAIAALVSAALWVALVAAWAWALAATGLMPAAQTHVPPLAPLVFAAGALLYGLAVAVHYLVWLYEESRAAEQRALELRVLAREAELRALRAQIDPHFLFNSLNSISALTGSDPEGARRMALRLADFLRLTLKFGDEGVVRFADELMLADHYLGVEQVRFGPRLDVVRHVEPEAADALVPPLLLQPLVENAVRHGIAHSLAGGTIQIEARVERGRLRIAVQNPRDSGASSVGSGIGLDNVRRRLATLHGGDAEMRVSAGDTSFRVEISLPVQTGRRADAVAPDEARDRAPAPTAPGTAAGGATVVARAAMAGGLA
jgi:hypothetical protein